MGKFIPGIGVQNQYSLDWIVIYESCEANWFFFNFEGFESRFHKVLMEILTDDRTSGPVSIGIRFCSYKSSAESFDGAYNWVSIWKKPKIRISATKNPLHQGKCVSKSSCKNILRKSWKYEKLLQRKNKKFQSYKLMLLE